MRYPIGTILYRDSKGYIGTDVVVVLNDSPYEYAPKNTGVIVKWATWPSYTSLGGLQESFETVPFEKFIPITEAGLLLLVDKSVIDDVKLIKTLIKLGYKGEYHTDSIEIRRIQKELTKQLGNYGKSRTNSKN